MPDADPLSRRLRKAAMAPELDVEGDLRRVLRIRTRRSLMRGHRARVGLVLAASTALVVVLLAVSWGGERSVVGTVSSPRATSVPAAQTPPMTSPPGDASGGGTAEAEAPERDPPPTGSPTPPTSSTAEPTPVPPCRDDQVSATVTTDKSSYTSGETVTAHAAIRNTSSEPCGVPSSVELHWRDDEGNAVGCSLGRHKDFPPGEGALEPGESDTIDAEWDQKDCREREQVPPGTYQVEVAWRGRSDPPWGASATFEIRDTNAPLAAGDAASSQEGDPLRRPGSPGSRR